MDLPQKIRSLPTSPGVYLYKNAEGEVIYVGKAKNLRSRVSSYFHRRTTQKTRRPTHSSEQGSTFNFSWSLTNNKSTRPESHLDFKTNPHFDVLLHNHKTTPT